jgi:chitinase
VASLVPLPVLLALALAVAAGSAAGADAAPPQAPGTPPRVIIGYVFPQERLLAPGEIDAARLTHVNYAFARVKDGRLAEGFSHDGDNLRVLTALRTTNPRLAVLVSIGGWSGSKTFSDVALTAESRARFAESAVWFLQRHDLDGLDVDWEYPGLPGDKNRHRPEDRANFTMLLRELRGRLDAAGHGRWRPYLLTIAAGAFPDYLTHTSMAEAQAAVDYVNLMAYDFRVPGAEPEAGHHANLLTHPQDPNALSADRAVREFLAAGVPSEKLVLGVPFYGHAWQAAGEYGPLYQPGRPAPGFGPGAYSVLRELASQPGWLRLWDDAAQAPWLWNPARRIFVSYEDPRSLRLKCRLVRERGLGGVMFWEYSQDAAGELLRTIDAELTSPSR